MKRKSKKQFAKELDEKLSKIEKIHKAKFDLFFYGLSGKVKKSGKIKFTKKDSDKLNKLFIDYYSEISTITIEKTNQELKHLSKQKNKYKKVIVPVITPALRLQAKKEALRKTRDYKNYLKSAVKNTDINLKDKKVYNAFINKKNKAFSNTHIKTVIQTDSIKVANEQRLEVFRESTIIKGVQFLAVTDNRTTDICSARHRLIFKLSSSLMSELQPPLHYNCRSILSPVTIFEEKVIVLADHKITKMNLPKKGFIKKHS